MYGAVNSALRAMVLTHYGDAMWRRICRQAGVDDGEFAIMESYPDASTYELVGALSEAAGRPVADLLEQFGRSFVRFAEEVYGEVFLAMGTDLRTFLDGLNHMHAGFSEVFPDYRPPKFRVETRSATELLLHYESHREGLEPFVVGLLQGLADRFGVGLAVQQTGRAGATRSFLLRLQQVAGTGPG